MNQPTISQQFLILHKVRGEPSFDCATKMEMDGEEWWITNSGYRAYPYWHMALTATNLYNDDLSPNFPTTVPADWPDHYECKGTIVSPKVDLSSLMSRLVPKITRRI